MHARTKNKEDAIYRPLSLALPASWHDFNGSRKAERTVGTKKRNRPRDRSEMNESPAADATRETMAGNPLTTFTSTPNLLFMVHWDQYSGVQFSIFLLFPSSFASLSVFVLIFFGFSFTEWMIEQMKKRFADEDFEFRLF